jgi:hypothetical protein
MLALLCSTVLLLQVTALPILHLLHWSDTVAFTTGDEAAATCCPHGHGARFEDGGETLPAHDSAACPTCAVLAQHRGVAVAALGVAPAPAMRAVGFAGDVHRVAASASRVVVGPRAPPLLGA